MRRERPIAPHAIVQLTIHALHHTIAQPPAASRQQRAALLKVIEVLIERRRELVDALAALGAR